MPPWRFSRQADPAGTDIPSSQRHHSARKDAWPTTLCGSRSDDWELLANAENAEVCLAGSAVSFNSSGSADSSAENSGSSSDATSSKHENVQHFFSPSGGWRNTYEPALRHKCRLTPHCTTQDIATLLCCFCIAGRDGANTPL